MTTHMYEPAIEEEARRSAAHRLAEGKGLVPTERRNEQAEKYLARQMMERARSGEHFPSSLHPA
jgi:hypothetical protein